MSNVVLKINGQSFEGWKSVQIMKSMKQLTSAFSFSVADRFSGKPSAWNIKKEDDCSIEIEGQTLITGYIDDIYIDYDFASMKEVGSSFPVHNIEFTGRGKTEDLVDCSFTGASEFKNQTVENIIKSLCSPFSISAVVDASVREQADKVIESFVPEQGSTVFEIIRKVTSLQAILPVDYGDGKLTLTRAGTIQATDSLELGNNIKSGSLWDSGRDRFSNYFVKGQNTGFDTLGLTDFVQPGAQHVDGRVQRFRPLVVLAEEGVTSGEAKTRAVWEAKTRAARSQKYTYIVLDWIQSDKTLWELNSLVKIKDTFLNIDSTKLIVSLFFSQNQDEGTITKIILVDKEALELLESPVEEIKTDFTSQKRSVSDISVVQLPPGIFEAG